MADTWTSRFVVGALAALTVSTLSPAFARADSTWLVCTGVVTAGTDKAYIAASLLESRAADGGNRDLDVTLIKGAHVWRSKILGAKAGDFSRKHVPLQIRQGRRTIFRGTARVSFRGKKQLELRGKMDMRFGYGKLSLVTATATLSCRQLDDLAIGHAPSPSW